MKFDRRTPPKIGFFVIFRPVYHTVFGHVFNFLDLLTCLKTAFRDNFTSHFFLLPNPKLHVPRIEISPNRTVNPKRIQVLNVATARSTFSAHLLYERIITDFVF